MDLGTLDDFAKTIADQVGLLATPIDFDQLCADGVLQRMNSKEFKVLDWKRLPKYASARISMFSITSPGHKIDTVEFSDTTEVAQQLLTKLKPR